MTDSNLLTDNYLDVMMAIWELGGAQVPTGDILRKLASKQRNKLQLLQVNLKTLTAKGFVSICHGKHHNTYTALIKEEDYVKDAMNNFIEHHYSGYHMEFLKEMIDKLSLEDRIAVGAELDNILARGAQGTASKTN